ncbi:hypothetical protein HBI56_135330 [Parastagonospora nodorum]|uniref:Secreted protein n=1 Tax=Phaeosphaeria nodorum (strain SN15 / ATCC MYA-4574 / FGSC 10173) TaxID=321614 RepID=A0A7U2F6X9_PHANO|nr:hypothetical protein HBH56_038430 [Parastagonospora nodorum]QRC99863.1 hypothetical protein JI435_414150 [Parastagonospora nodorum SN15]KAH3933979.1 hypothetical protein HBH54_061030 [Parastagonospora nodorum]KAH3941080.1 hypothetical protein HBH53_207250 [Parastagonospora nodorum]KAH3957991.1 hypothetical protein HBH51_214950 [Parastagonospora nodorum]
MAAQIRLHQIMHFVLFLRRLHRLAPWISQDRQVRCAGACSQICEDQWSQASPGLPNVDWRRGNVIGV